MPHPLSDAMQGHRARGLPGCCQDPVPRPPRAPEAERGRRPAHNALAWCPRGGCLQRPLRLAP